MSAKEVYALRKEGKLKEALELAEKDLKEEPNNQWNINALAWTLIDLCKKNKEDKEKLKKYLKELEKLDFKNDEILPQQFEYVKRFLNPDLIKAKELSNKEKHEQALEFFQKAYENDKENEEIKKSFGWTIYKAIKKELEQEHPNIEFIKQKFLDYFKLKINDSTLHSQILFTAVKKVNSKDNKRIQILPFLKMWGLNNFTQKDYEQFYDEKHRNYYPSNAEKALREAINEAIERNDKEFIKQALPLFDKIIKLTKDPTWCFYSLAQAHLELKNLEEALKNAKKVLKAKKNESWMWNFMGEIYKNLDEQKEMACYAKALSFRNKENFVYKIRIKFTETLIKIEEFAYAKDQLEKIIKYVKEDGIRIPVELIEIEKNPNLKIKPEKNYQLEQKLIENANLILGEAKPIEREIPNKATSQIKLEKVKANLSAEFEKNNQIRKKIHNLYYLNKENKPVKIEISKSKTEEFEKIQDGTSVFAQISNENGKTQIHKITPRDGQNYDVLEKRQNEIIKEIKEGPKNSALMSLAENFTIKEKDLALIGFTQNNIFIPNELIKKYKLKKGDKIDIFVAYELDKNELRPFAVDLIK